MCFNATTSLIAGTCSYGVAAYLHRRNQPKLKWAAVALTGITAMQWVEGFIWLGDPRICGIVNMLLTIGTDSGGPFDAGLGSSFWLDLRSAGPVEKIQLLR